MSERSSRLSLYNCPRCTRHAVVRLAHRVNRYTDPFKSANNPAHTYTHPNTHAQTIVQTTPYPIL